MTCSEEHLLFVRRGRALAVLDAGVGAGRLGGDVALRLARLRAHLVGQLVGRLPQVVPQEGLAWEGHGGRRTHRLGRRLVVLPGGGDGRGGAGRGWPGAGGRLVPVRADLTGLAELLSAGLDGGKPKERGMKQRRGG